MKQITLILAFLMLMTSVFAVQQNYGDLDASYNYVHVTSIKYEPYPAEPGKYIDLWIKVENAGIDKADVKFKLTPKYPFSLDSNEVAERDLGELAAMETTLIHYKVRTASDAVEGDNPLYYETNIGGSVQTSSLDIWVQTIDANIAVNSIKASAISPGETSNVEIELENLADSPMSNVNVKLDLTAAATPFVPINSTSEKKIFVIKPGEKESIIFSLMALPDSSSNVYKIPIEITFVDGTGKNYTKSSIIGLVVGAEPDLSVTIAQTGIYSTGTTGSITLKITNKGLTDTKLMNIILEEDDSYSILSEKEIYIGNIDSDDYETADYSIKVNKLTKGKAILKLSLDYLDANNRRYKETRNVELDLSGAKELSNGNGGASFIKLVFIIILIVLGFLMYRRWEKNRLSKR